MLKRSNLILLAVALVLALLTTLLVVRELGAQTKAKQAATQVPTEQVVVVAKDVPNHTKIDATDVAVKQVPTTSVAPGAATQASQVVGQYTTKNWSQGQQVVSAMYGSGTSTKFSAQIPKGERALTIPNSLLEGVDYLVTPGDHIDILGSGSGKTATNGYTTVSDVLVLFVDKMQSAAKGQTTNATLSSSPSGGDTITVAVTPKQAQALAKLIDSGSKLHYLLHNSSEK